MRTDKPTPPADEAQDPVAALLRSAGPRRAPDPQRMQRASEAVHAEWQSAIGRRHQLKWYALAAAVAMIGIGLWFVARVRPEAAVPVATAARVTGEVFLRYATKAGASTDVLAAGHVIKTGAELNAGATGRALLNWTSGLQLRIDRYSLVRLQSTANIQLDRGAIYVETGANSSEASAKLTISTPFGAVRHVGTRFEVRVVDGGTRVRVRDGLATFSGQGRAVPVRAGQQLSVSRKGVVLEAGPGLADPEWEWVREIAPSFTMEGRSLFDTLAWLSHESGLRVVYRGGQARAHARAVILRGSIEGLDHQQAMLAVLAGSGLAYGMFPDRVEIRLNDPR